MSTAANHRDGTVENYERIYRQAQAWIRSNCHKPNVNINLFYPDPGCSRRTVQRILKDHGTCWRRMLVQIRMAEAARLLRETELAISTIAFKVGYSNVEHFIKVFKRECKILPTIYRKENRDGRSA